MVMMVMMMVMMVLMTCCELMWKRLNRTHMLRGTRRAAVESNSNASILH
jgi:hypothetical protein